jgi:hypothetical protein
MPDAELITKAKTPGAKANGFSGSPPAPLPPKPDRPPVRQMLPGVRAKLAEISGTSAAVAFDDADDSLAPARGIAAAVVLATPFWGMVGAAVWAVLK